MTRKCIFCGKGVLTREHAWPDWLLRMRPHPTPVVLRGRRGAGTAEVVWSTSDPAIRVKHVCGTCNHGWMSKLESAVKPSLAALVDGSPPTLSSAEFSAIARWAVKTAMVFEMTSADRDRFYSAEERFGARAGADPPHGTRVWLGASASEIPFFAAARSQRDIVGTPYSVTRVHTATFGYGHLVVQLQALRCSPPPPLHHHVNIEAANTRWNDALALIWPPPPSPPTITPSPDLSQIRALSGRFESA